MTHDHEHEHGGHEHHHHAPMSYAEAVEAFRADKDEFFRTQPRSPIPEAERAAFTGLPYFPVNEALLFDGLSLEPYDGDEPTSFAIPTTDGGLRPAVRAGTFRFEIGGAEQSLTGYRFADVHHHDDDSVFVPFIDGTSGVETYEAGRYLDLEPEDDGTFTLDFNLAYNPSCVYDPKYACPLTPAENRLAVRIEAGERISSEGGAH